MIGSRNTMKMYGIKNQRSYLPMPNYFGNDDGPFHQARRKVVQGPSLANLMGSGTSLQKL